MTMPTERDMAQAIKDRDENFNGQFVYGVVTTGVFCQPACPSRLANPQNIRYFCSNELAMLAGFRACKRCHPNKDMLEVERLVNVARYIEKHLDESLSLTQLANVSGLSSSWLQRRFKIAFGLSPKVYQDGLRMEQFKLSLQAGEGITESIFASGYSSISRVYGEATRHLGMNPKVYRAGGRGELIYYAFVKSALGLIAMAATQKGVCFAQFGESEASLIEQMQSEFSAAELIPSHAQDTLELDNWIEALNQHISQAAPRPDLPLDMRGTVFQVTVWKFLLSIKEGDVLSYSDVANGIDKPKAFRAVATACAKNRIGILIPCHRVLRGDGTMGGYRWGLERKRILLDAERAAKAVVHNRG